MQVIVLVVQNSVPADQIGTATSTNNYFREVGAALGVAVFGSIFTTRLAESLTKPSPAPAPRRRRPPSPPDAGSRRRWPASRPAPGRIVNAYADSLAPVFWYLVPFIAVALVLALTLKQIPLSDTAGMVARGEAVGGEEAERLEAALREPALREPESRGPAAREPELLEADGVKDDDGELAGQRR